MSSALAMFMLLIFCFCVPIFVSADVFLFHRVVNFKSLFLENKMQSNPVVGGISNEHLLCSHIFSEMVGGNFGLKWRYLKYKDLNTIKIKLSCR